MKRLFQKNILALIVISLLFGSCAHTASERKCDNKPFSLESDSVIMLSAKWCYWCGEAKKFLEKNNIDYMVMDIEDDLQAKIFIVILGHLNYTGEVDRVPAFIVRKQVLVGYNPGFILNILGKK